MRCPQCQQDNPPRAKFCLDCGASFKGSRECVRHEVSNADLQRALSEALEQQAATSEILRVISQSPTDAQPIFDAIVRNASRLCGGEWAIVTRYDGELLHLVAQHNPRPGFADTTSRFFPQVPRHGTSIMARALVDAAVVHVSDVETEDLEPSAHEQYRRIRLRAALAVPMVHEGRPIGVVSVSRETPGPFSDRQIDLLCTFAAQAVIAIENVRLFRELEDKNRALTEAHAQVSESLEQQTATAEILSVISGSPTDIRPVFDAVLDRALTLCEASNGSLYQLEDGALRHVGLRGPHLGIEVGGVFSAEVLTRARGSQEANGAPRRHPAGARLARSRTRASRAGGR